MKKIAIIGIVIVIVLILFLLDVFNSSPSGPIDDIIMPFEIEGFDQNINSEVPLNEELVIKLSQKVLNAIEYEKYIVTRVTKDESNRWVVGFSCVDSPARFLCGGEVKIDETDRKIVIMYYR